MRPPLPITAVCLLLAACTAGSRVSVGGGQEPGPMEAGLLERCKDATVFVQVRQVDLLDPTMVTESSGSGFLVSTDGLVVTNWHVIDDTHSEGGFPRPERLERVEVLLHSGTDRQELLRAMVLAVDRDRDLALLRLARNGCPLLPLAPAGLTLFETQPVWVFGYPFGQLFSVLQRGPEISVNLGRITSLRHDERGELLRLQLDAAVNRGNSGGPLLLPDGRVAGVTNIALGDSRVNFAVPVAALHRLLATCPAVTAAGDACRVTLTSTPAGAGIWHGGHWLGITPLTATLPGGWQELAMTAPDRLTWSARVTVHEGATVHADLPAARSISLRRTPPAPADPPPDAPRVDGEELWREDFTDPAAIATWRQDTGGTEDRAWYIADGRLHQFFPRGTLHAIIADAGEWGDAAIAADLRIGTNTNDGRAGIIFAATDDGFALLRIHRASAKVQLVYHDTNPFGWRVLAERRLGSPIADDTWFRLEVRRTGDRILGLVDGTPVIAACFRDLPRGRVGFYAVDAPAAFDRCRVQRLTDPLPSDPPAIGGTGPFWFNEDFTKPVLPWTVPADDVVGRPWSTVRGACLQDETGPGRRRLQLTRYDLDDCEVHCLISTRQGAAGLVFRDQEDRRYLFLARTEDDVAELVLEQAETRRGLVSTPGIGNLPMPDDRTDGTSALHYLSLRLDGDHLVGSINHRQVFDLRDAGSDHGRLGLYTEDGTAVFHHLRVSSLQPMNDSAPGGMP